MRNGSRRKAAGGKHPLVVTGASSGGIEALHHLLPQLPRDFQAAVLVVVHIAASSPNLLDQVLAKHSLMPVRDARDGELIKPGNIYVAQPDLHLTVEQDHLRLIHGPKENRHRPAIDPLFRSVAWQYAERAIGLLLTGNLNDGTAGLWAIKNSGGRTIVQDPAEAAYPDMPYSAITEVRVDHIVPIQAIAPLLQKLVTKQKNGSTPPRRRGMKLETEIAEMKQPLDATIKLGKPSCFTCPDCNGTLFQLHADTMLRFRCRTGHSFTAESLEAGLTDEIENALWFALRALGEKANLLRDLVGKARDKGQSLSSPLR
ncbi:MAG TPA: chemotaxis protein CheB [Verrucomicrobiae bacterium]|nr:chemotaxis protein CheB [Verrucomicrobiae bacterium]